MLPTNPDSNNAPILIWFYINFIYFII